MAVNLQTKFGAKIANKFYLNSVVANKSSKEFEWVGADTIKIIAPTTQAMKDYSRTGATARFGGMAELQDTVQSCALSKDRSFDIAIDKGNYKEGGELKVAGKMLALQNREQAIPEFDTHCLTVWSTNAGTTSVTAAASLTKSNIVEKIGEGVAALVNGSVNVSEGCYLYIGATNFAKLIASPEFVNIHNLGEEATKKGIVGMVRGLNVVQVPDSYMKSDTNFLIVKKDAVLAPMTIKTLRILDNDADIDGVRLQGRYRYDAFVIEGRKNGVFASITAARS